MLKTCTPDGRLETISAATSEAFNVFALVGSLLASIMVVGYLVVYTVDAMGWDASALVHKRLGPDAWNNNRKIWKSLRMILCLLIFPALSVIQLAALITIRKGQKKLAEHLNVDFEDDHWGFGQIISATVWIPVVVEFGYGMMYGAYGDETGSNISIESSS